MSYSMVVMQQLRLLCAAILVVSVMAVCSHERKPVFEGFSWQTLVGECTPSSGRTRCFYRMEVDAAGVVTSSSIDYVEAYTLSPDELTRFEADITSPAVVAMFRQGCHTDSRIAGDEVTLTLKLVGEDLLSVGYAGCPGDVIFKIDYWVSALFREPPQDAGIDGV